MTVALSLSIKTRLLNNRWYENEFDLHFHFHMKGDTTTCFDKERWGNAEVAY